MSEQSGGTPRAQGFRFPAEWEPQRAVWLSFPHNEDDYPGKLSCVQWAYCELIRELTQAGRVALLVASGELKQRAQHQLTQSGVDFQAIEFHQLPTNRAWTRDFLPNWLLRGTALGAVKWRFNAWARYDNYELDEAAGQRVAELRTQHVWQPLRIGQAERFVLEGGALETDGEGTLLTTTDCLLTARCARNPGQSQAQIEETLREYLAVEKVIWLPGDVAGDDTSGHIDDVARFVGPATVVLPQESNSKDVNYSALERAREALEGERDARGRKLEIVRLPMPAPRTFDGDRLPATYANFLIANDRVLVPTFNDPADRVALGVLSELFAGRRVCGIYCGDWILGLGALHCATHQEPLAD